MNSKCIWIRAFDAHFNIGCANENGQRGNANFKRCSVYRETKWDFKYCPYCGKEIEINQQPWSNEQ